MLFSLVKRGYDIRQVDDYIEHLNLNNDIQFAKQRDRIKELQAENDELKLKLEEYAKKEGSISDALLVAVDKAKQIEEVSKKVYDLEIQKIRLLYNRYKNLLQDLKQKNSSDADIENTKKVISEFKESMNEVINSKEFSNVKTNSTYDPMRALLGKMNNYIAKRNMSKENADDDLDGTLQKERTNIKPIADIEINNDEKFENLVDKFLEMEDDGNSFKSDYEKQFETKKESKFDIKEAVNPTESLEEIMKSFDFFNPDEK